MDPLPRLSQRRTLVVLGGLYLSQGAPFGFFQQTVPVLLREQKIALWAIGLITLLAAAWALKPLAGPWVDRTGTGRRRRWIVPLHAGVVLAFALLSACPPASGLLPLLVTVAVVNLLAATEDVATDALAVDALPPGARGAGNAVQVGARRIGIVVGGGLLLLVLDAIGWARGCLLLAGVVAACLLPLLLLGEPPPAVTPTSAPPASLREAARGRGGWLLAVAAFQVGYGLTEGMVRAFLVDHGLGLREIGGFLGVLGALGSAVGALGGALAVARLGRMGAVLAGGLAQAATAWAWAAAAGAPGPLSRGELAALCVAEQLAAGLAMSALFTLLMDACRPRSAATDYALQSWAVIMGQGVGASLSGFVAERLGYAGLFAAGGATTVVATLVLARLGPPGAAQPEVEP